MIRPRTVGGRTLAALSVALLAWIAAGRSGGEPLVPDPSGPHRAGAIEAVPTVLITVSDRPVFSDGARRADGTRALMATGADGARHDVLVSWGGDLRRSHLLQTAGPLAVGLSRRGPPVWIRI